MKGLFIITFCFLFINTAFSQLGGEEEENYLDNELTVQIINAPYTDISFVMTPIGMVFCKSSPCSFTASSSANTETIILNGGSSGNVLCAYNGFELRNCNEGNGTDISNCAQQRGGLKPLRWAFYRIDIVADNVIKKRYTMIIEIKVSQKIPIV
jgi:hypothetical protein